MGGALTAIGGGGTREFRSAGEGAAVFLVVGGGGTRGFAAAGAGNADFLVNGGGGGTGTRARGANFTEGAVALGPRTGAGGTLLARFAV